MISALNEDRHILNEVLHSHPQCNNSAMELLAPTRGLLPGLEQHMLTAVHTNTQLHASLSALFVQLTFTELSVDPFANFWYVLLRKLHRFVQGKTSTVLQRKKKYSEHLSSSSGSSPKSQHKLCAA